MPKKDKEIGLLLSQTQEKITPRSGLILFNAFLNHTKLLNVTDTYLQAPGSNRGYLNSQFIKPLLLSFLDGGSSLEDLNILRQDKAMRKALGLKRLPSSDAAGDWLRRKGAQGGIDGMLNVVREMFSRLPGNDFTLDIDATIFEAEKGDARKTYKGTYGYQPMLGVIAENKMVCGVEFRHGNHSPQEGIVRFVEHCLTQTDDRIGYIRSDSAAYQKKVVRLCKKKNLRYSITASHSSAVRELIGEIPEHEWTQGVDEENLRQEYEVAETRQEFAGKRNPSRLVVKRTKRTGQVDMFDKDTAPYFYWAIVTNLPKEQYTANAVILTHQKRGSMENTIGEIKHQVFQNYLPCGQFAANGLYFLLGILAYNIIQAMKQNEMWTEYRSSTVNTIRHHIIHLAGRLCFHANAWRMKIASPDSIYALVERTYLFYTLAPL